MVLKKMLAISLRWNILYMCVVYLWVFVSVLDGRQTCGDSLYYNTTTQTCTSCRDRSVCGRGAPFECSNTCAFLKGCQDHYYFDITTGACTSCADLCHQAEVRGTEKDCRHLCPVDIDHPTAPQSALRLQTDHPLTTTVYKDTFSTASHPGSVAVVLLLVSVIVTAVLTLLTVVIWKRRQWIKCYQRDTYSPSPQTEEEIPLGKNAPVHCTASVDSVSCLSHFDPPGVQVSTPDRQDLFMGTFG